MDLYNKLLNIKGENIASLISDAIKEVKSELKDLDYERMCLVYNSYLYKVLVKKHVLVHIIDTLDLGFTYNHRFLLAFDGIDYYLCDLTYSQFASSSLSELLNSGYIKCDNQVLKTYLNIVGQKEIEMNIAEVFTSKNNR